MLECLNKIKGKVKQMTRMTKMEKLLNKIKEEGGMTHEDIVRFLLKSSGNQYNPTTRSWFDSNLYGTKTREGVLERFCRKLRNGKWKMKAGITIEAPFSPRRTMIVEDYRRDNLGRFTNTYSRSRTY